MTHRATDLTDDTFSRELVAELARGNFRRAAWRRFWVRARERALALLGTHHAGR